MQFIVWAAGRGKFIQVIDRAANAEVFNRFVDPDERAAVDVASQDGRTGNVDVNARNHGNDGWTVRETDYDVRAGEEVRVDDV